MTEPHRITISSPAALLGAIPALLGFVPERSVVVLLFGPDRLQLVARVDSDDPDAHRIADEARKNASTAAFLVAVAEARYASEALTQLDTLRAALDRHRVPVRGAYYIHRLIEGASWTDLDSHATGTVDPAASPVTAAHAVTLGRRVAASRADLEARYSAADDEADTIGAVAEYQQAPTVFARDTLTAVFAAVAEGIDVGDELAARVAVLVLSADKAHRDALLALGVIDEVRALDVMAGIARRARGNARVHVLTLAGLFAHATGSGAEARIAYDQAHRLAARMRRPVPTLLTLAESALDSVLFPDRIRELFTAAVDVVAELGIELPDPR